MWAENMGIDEPIYGEEFKSKRSKFSCSNIADRLREALIKYYEPGFFTRPSFSLFQEFEDKETRLPFFFFFLIE